MPVSWNSLRRRLIVIVIRRSRLRGMCVASVCRFFVIKRLVVSWKSSMREKGILRRLLRERNY